MLIPFSPSWMEVTAPVTTMSRESRAKKQTDRKTKIERQRQTDRDRGTKTGSS